MCGLNIHQVGTGAVCSYRIDICCCIPAADGGRGRLHGHVLERDHLWIRSEGATCIELKRQ